MENDTGTLVGVAIVALIFGMLIGALIFRSFMVDPARSRRLSQKVEELTNSQSLYQAQVSEHFMQTASLIKRLNEDYAEIHRHLAKGAQELCSDDSMQEFTLINGSNHKTRQVRDDDYDPTRDYAPKQAHDDKGTLSEDFGLRKKQADN